MKFISGGVTAAKGFKAAGIHCGLRKNRTKADLALIYSDKRCAAAAIYTKNLVKGAPITVTKENISDGYAQAVIANSGNANTCNADGIEKARKMCSIAANVLSISPKDVIVASTGVIGQSLNIEPIEEHAEELAAALSENGSIEAARAIMTTDTVEKEAAVELEIDGKTVHIGAISKGSGMIHPNMCTMLAFAATDCAITPEMLHRAIKLAADNSFHRISVDGDSSTNDTFAVMANGEAGNAEISEEDESFSAFAEGLCAVCLKLAKLMAGDGEGATKLLICRAEGAADKETAEVVSKAVICSSLVKAAMFGADANWGRVLCAIGYSGAQVDVNRIDVSFISSKGRVDVCKNGAGVDFSEDKAGEILHEKEITILVALNSGGHSAEAYGCDLTYDYVKINGDYRT